MLMMIIINLLIVKKKGREKVILADSGVDIQVDE